MTTLANYHAEREAFRSLLDPACERRILMFRGESGSGKSTLMGSSCRAAADGPFPFLAVDLRGTTTNVPEILSRSVVKLGGLQRLPRLAERLRSLSQVPSLNLADNTLEGTQNQINVVVRNRAPVEREERYVQLTDAWFEDLGEAESPLLLLFDTYEQAGSEVKDWIAGPLLARTADSGALRVTVAGQQVPERRIDWEYCCEVCDLYGVREAEPWLPVVEAMGCRFPEGIDPLSFLAGICLTTNGNPGEIMKVIKGLPRGH